MQLVESGILEVNLKNQTDSITIESDNLKVQSYDIEKHKIVFKNVFLLSKRYENELFHIKCHYGYNLSVSPLHPLTVSVP